MCLDAASRSLFIGEEEDDDEDADASSVGYSSAGQASDESGAEDLSTRRRLAPEEKAEWKRRKYGPTFVRAEVCSERVEYTILRVPPACTCSTDLPTLCPCHGRRT
jgi:hypothetical protein